MSMKEKVLKVIVITLLVTSIVLADFMVLAVDIISYAADTSNSGNVEFISYFELEDGSKTNHIEKTINNDDIKLCMEIEVREEGFLNGEIELKNSGLKFKQEEIQEVAQISGNTITLKQVNAGEKVKIQVGIEIALGEEIDLSTWNQDSKVVLTGTYTNAKQKESDVEIESNMKISLTSPYQEAEEGVQLDTQIITNKLYNINGENKRIVQVLVNSGLKEDGYPIKQTNIEIQAPEGAQEIQVLDRGTLATNGRQENQNTQDSFQYTQNGNTLQISIVNQEEDGKIKYGSQKQDCIIVTYVYNEEEQIEGKEIKVKDVIQLYDETGTELEKENTNKVEEEKDEIIGYKIISEANIYKGKMYAKQPQEYKSISEIDIRYPQVEKNIQITEGKANYSVQIDENIYTADANVVYKTSTIDKEQLLRVLGDNGEMVIKKLDGTEIKKINKETINTEENEQLEITYEDNQNEIVIEVNNAENVGTIQIKNVKEIRQETIERETFKLLTNLTIRGNLSETENIKAREVQSNINLQETETKAEMEISTSELSAGKTNKNVEIKTTLLTNSNAYDLYKNPIIEIEFPEEIKDVVINDVNALYGEELSKQSEQVYENEAGRKVVRIEFAGEQTNYSENELIKGTNIILNCNLTVDSMEENKSNNITLRYTNDKDVQYNNNGIYEVGVNYIVAQIVDMEANNLQDSNLQVANEAEQIETTDPIIVTKSITAGNGNDIYERQVQKYTIKVKNNTDNDISNITVEDDIPSELIYCTAICDMGFENEYQEYEQTTKCTRSIELIKANEEVEVNYYVRVKQSTENQGKTIGTKAVATIEGDTNQYESNLVENTIKESKFQVDMIAAANATGKYIKGSGITYKIVVKNITSENLKGVTITSTLPEGVSYLQAADMLYDEEGEYYYRNETENVENANYDSNNGVVTWDIGDLDSGKETAVYLTLKLNPINGNDEQKIVATSVAVQANNTDKYYSNVEEITEINSALCSIEMKTNLDDKYVYEGDEFEYIVTISNTGTIRALSAMLTDELPDGVTLKEINYTVDGENKQMISNAVAVTCDLEPGQTMEVRILVKVNNLPTGTQELTIKNKAKLENSEIDSIVSNEVINVIRKKENGNSDENLENNNGDPANNSKKYNIKGTAWIDSNRDGSRDSTENTLVGIEVDLYNENGQKATDSNGNTITTKTTNDGTYVLSNIEKGKYIVVFHYDSSNYSLTEYKKSGVSEELNSNVTKAEIEGNTVAITDKIDITTSNVENVNMGVIENSKFDLKLDKYISGVTVQSSTATKKYGYNNANFVKVEVDRKTINSTTVTIEYKISVTNEGEVPGYAKKVVDYISSDLNFNSQLNKDWTVENGQLVSTSLANEIINPGETKTLDLILMKKLTEDNLGTVTNTAEILEDYNENLIGDIDSTVGNKKSDEDDMSTVSVIIGIKTGRVIIYTTLIIASIMILGVGIYLINKKVLKS